MNPSEVLLREHDRQEMIDDVKEHAEKQNETVFSLIGVIHSNQIYEVTRVVKGGAKCDRSSASCRTDEEVIVQALKEEQEKNQDVRYLGDFHSHPWPVTPHPSSIDTAQLELERRTRKWFVIGIFSSEGELKIFGSDGKEIVEIPYRIIKDGISEENLLSRITEITDSKKLAESNVLILGCGSLGSGFATGIAGSGIINYIAADMDPLSLVNVIRHLGNIDQLGYWKTEIIKNHIQLHQPLARVQTVNENLIKNGKLLQQLIEWSDIVVASSGNPELNYHINSICVKMKKPAVFGGIFDKAENAYMFYYSGKEDVCCFDCIFDLTTSAIDQNTINRKYGLEDGELKGAQGHYCDIAIPGLIMAKMTLNLLLGKEMKYNLIRYYDDSRIKRINVSRKKRCATCDYENWLAKEEENLKSDNFKNKLLKMNWRELAEKIWRTLN